MRQLLQRVPAVVVDACLAVAMAIAVTIAIRLARQEGAERPDAFAYALGLTIAALVLVRRRWPLGVLLASTATLEVYYLLDYPGMSPAVPLAVALSTATAAGHLRWSLAVTTWFALVPIVFRTRVLAEPLLPVLGDAVRDGVLLGAVLVLGEALRSRRALSVEQEKSERLLLNVLPAPIAARLKQTEDVIADRYAEATVLFADIELSRRLEPFLRWERDGSVLLDRLIPTLVSQFGSLLEDPRHRDALVAFQRDLLQTAIRAVNQQAQPGQDHMEARERPLAKWTQEYGQFWVFQARVGSHVATAVNPATIRHPVHGPASSLGGWWG